MRLIDADAFIEKLGHVPMVQEAIKRAMDTMPTIEPEHHWIPVSEKLPKNRTMVLVTCADEFHRWVDDDEFIDGKFWYCGENVVAWCEYPEPWKGEQDG